MPPPNVFIGAISFVQFHELNSEEAKQSAEGKDSQTATGQGLI